MPVYLVDWPIAQSPRAAEILRGPLAAGKAEIGVQLHPWVNPPFDEEVTPHNSFAGNLPRELERAKFRNLRDAIERNFEAAPAIYRAGRYGVGPELRRRCCVEGGDRDRHLGARQVRLQRGRRPELPPPPARALLARRRATPARAAADHGVLGHAAPPGRVALPGAVARAAPARRCSPAAGLLERIPLTPEGVSVDEAIRGIDIALDDGLPLLVFSFHSPSLRPGHTPYVRNEADLDALYDWWRRVFAYLELREVAPTTVREIMAAVRR